MLLNTLKKEEDLIRLKDFCLKDKVCGYVPNVWFTQLRNKYPWHYVLNVQHKWSIESKEYFFKVLGISYTNKIRKLIELGVSNEDLEILETLNSKLDNLIKSKEL
jgi:hypothetical protein